MSASAILAVLTLAGCRSERAVAHPTLDALGTTSASSVVVPGAPRACVSNVQVYVPHSGCAGWPPPAGEQPGASVAGTLVGATGDCILQCSVSLRDTHWSFRLVEPGWRGTASCSVPGHGDMEVRAVEHIPGQQVDPAVAALWLTPTGMKAWVMPEITLPDGTVQVGISEGGCPGGQPSRGPG